MTTPQSLPPNAHIHLIAVGGVGMATLAAMLRERGYRVTGSDQGVYPPMSDFLAEAGIDVMQGYRAENLTPTPDLDEDVQVFIAEAVRLRGYEATTTRDQGRLGADDEDQLAFTQEHSLTMFTYNVSDFPRLHYQWLAAGKQHAGIIIAPQETLRQNIRALLHLLALVTAEEMVDQLEYLNRWA